jgi:hypothetical protein
MKRIFQLIILIICQQVTAQEKPQAITITSFGKFDTLKAVPMTVVDTKKLVRKTLSQEISLKKPLGVYVAMGGLLTIRTWNESKVKIETSIWIEGDNDLTDEKWLDKIGLSAKLSGDSVMVNTRQKEIFLFESPGNRFMNISLDRNRNQTQAVYYGNGSPRGVVNDNREVTLYVPSTSKLEIENKFGLLALPNNVKDISIINTNGEINAADIDNLELHSSSGRFIAGVIRNGNINISHGRLYLAELRKGILTTAYNTIEIEKAGDIQLNSGTDDIDIGESGSISGIKNYGTLQISVSGRVDLQGVNSRIKLKSIAPSTELIRIFDMNTDLRIPLREPGNYAIGVKGSYINLYSSYSNKMTIDTLTANESAEIKVKKDSLLALAKILGSRNAIAAGGGAITGSRPGRPVLPTDTYTTSRLTGFTKDSSLNSTTTINLKGAGVNPATAITLKDENIKTGTTITVRDSFTTVKTYKYSIKTGDAGNQTKFDITCTNCTVDFK